MSDEKSVSTIVVGGKEFTLVKVGREQAEQVIQLGKWVNTHGVPAIAQVMNEEGEISFDNGLDLLGDIIEVLTADALIDLFVVILGCSKTFANKHFDIAVLIEAVMLVYENQPSLGRVLGRFFSQASSEESTEEPSTT